MKFLYKWLSPLLVAIFASCSIWLITDIAKDVRFWEAGWPNLRARLEAFILVMAACLILNRIYNRITDYYIKKNRVNAPKNRNAEYGLVFLVIILVTNIIYLLVTYYVNVTEYRWGESGIINAICIPIMFLYYIFMRSSKVDKAYTQQNLLLEKVKVDQLETELKFLKSQYHPHFLFNALNTVYVQVDKENKPARQTIELLSDLLRYQLYNVSQEVTVGQEIEYLNTYIRFQKLRMSDRLKLKTTFDPQVNELKVSPLLFQPLLENAFKYVDGDYWITISVCLEEDKIHFTIENSVLEAMPDDKINKGIGIENLRRRLDLLYPGRYSLNIVPKENSFFAELIIKAA